MAKKKNIMTCGELIELLQKFDPKRPVVLYPETDYYKEQCKYYITGAAELDYDNQVALLMSLNKLVSSANYDKVKIVDEENGLVLTAETDNVVNIIV